ncbi:MAG: polyphosphate kinase [Porticoccaceae bacterium]|nr:polyphosphate kinase [Porticoccaceae bacterium]
MSKAKRLDAIDLDRKLADKDEYQSTLSTLQSRLALQQIAAYHRGRRIVILFEGWDASGKGGAIRRLGEKLDPRSYTVFATGKPSDEESRQHYLQRFWRRMPSTGQIVVFDRSWYGRVLVERIEGFADRAAWRRAYTEINEFERQLVDDGVIVIKLFMHISQEEQLKRYLERLNNPRKNWKLTEEDLRNRASAGDYLNAYQDMLDRTDTKSAPWHLIAGNHKWYARTQVLKTITDWLAEHMDCDIPTLSNDEKAAALRALGLDDGG